MANLLKDRVAVITGSGQGIGRAIALAMAGQGAKVVTNNRGPGSRGGDAATTAKEITDMGGQAIPVFADVAKFDDAEKLVQAAVKQFGHIDILVNNAQVYSPGPVWELTEEDWDKCLDSGLKGVFNCTRHACALMKEQRWGRIISAASAAWTGTFEACNYGAAKAGVVGLTKSVARDMGQFGVTCNAFAPSAATRWSIEYDSIERWRRQYEAGIITAEVYEARKKLVKPPPETTSPLLVYLCTDQAANMNGQIFRIKGNRITLYGEPDEKNYVDKADGLWTVEELIDLIPGTILKGYKNPAPAKRG